MKKLTLEGIDFTRHEEAFRSPIIGCLEWIIAHTDEISQLKVEDRFGKKSSVGSAFSCPGDVKIYLEKLWKFFSEHALLLSPKDILELIRIDQAARLSIGWRRLDKSGPRIRKPEDMVLCRRLLTKIFRYETFVSGRSLKWDSETTTLKEVDSNGGERWDAYRFHAEVLRVNRLRYCPYCNADMVYSVPILEDDVGGMRTDLDHFFPRSRYPYLALSPYNLVPSCARCNQRLKHDMDVLCRLTKFRRRKTYEGNLASLPKMKLAISYPYGDDFASHVRFGYRSITPELLIGNATEQELRLKVSTDEENSGGPFESSVTTFRLRTVYERLYSRELRELPIRLRMAASGYPEVIAESIARWKRKPSSEVRDADWVNRIKEYLAGAYVFEDRINEECLGKLRFDIARQLGVTK